MKMYLMLLLGLIATVKSRAQNELYEGQKFNRVIPMKPMIGFDLIRSFNPMMIVQKRPADGSGWQDWYKYITKPSVYSGLYDEIGTYMFDTISNVWQSNMVNRYQIDYDGINKRVRGAEEIKEYNNGTYIYKLKSRFVFNENKLDSELYDNVLSNGQTSNSSYQTYSYDSSGKAVKSELEYPSINYRIAYQYFYDTQNRLTAELSGTLSENGYDSSTQTTYLYDTLGRLIQYRLEAFAIEESPYTWTTVRLIDYVYDNRNSIINSNIRTYNHKDNFKEVPLVDYEYKYDAEGKLIEYLETNYSEGIVVDGGKTIFVYDASGHATGGFGYDLKNGDFGSTADYRYIFSQTVTALHEPLIKSNAKTLVVYPNPARETICFNELGNEMEIDIFNSKGRKILHIKATDNKERIHISSFPKGLYFIIAADGRKLKLIKE